MVRKTLWQIALVFLLALPHQGTASETGDPVPSICEITFDPPAGEYLQAFGVYLRLTFPPQEPPPIIQLPPGTSEDPAIIICYTLDGSVPTMDSTVWNGIPIPITANTIITAALFNSDGVAISLACSASYSFSWDGISVDPPSCPMENLPPVPQPCDASPLQPQMPACTGPLTVTLTAENAPAETRIYFCSDHHDPELTNSFVLPNDSITVDSTTELRTRAWNPLFGFGRVFTNSYAFIPEKPVLTPPPGELPRGTEISVSSPTASVQVFYSTVSPPYGQPQVLQESDWIPYSSPLILTNDTTFYFRLLRPGYLARFYSASYTLIRLPRVEFQPNPVVLDVTTPIAMSCAEPAATIHYTTDGTEPTELSPQYQAAVPVTPGTRLRAKAFHPDYNPSFTSYSFFRTMRSAESTNSILDQPAITLLQLGLGDRPVWLTHPGDGTHRLFICYEAGVIYAGKPEPFLNLVTYPPIVMPLGESAPELVRLVSVAFPPDFDRSGFFYVSYFRCGKFTISRFTSLGNPDFADVDSEEILFEATSAFDCSGQLLFSSTGRLYVNLRGPVSPSTIMDLHDDLSVVPGKFAKFDLESKSMTIVEASSSTDRFDALLAEDCETRGALKIKNSGSGRLNGLWLVGRQNTLSLYSDEKPHGLLFTLDPPISYPNPVAIILAENVVLKTSALGEDENGVPLLAHYAFRVWGQFTPGKPAYMRWLYGGIHQIVDDKTQFRVHVGADGTNRAITWFGPPNSSYEIQRSADLREWQTIQSFDSPNEVSAYTLPSGDVREPSFFRVLRHN